MQNSENQRNKSSGCLWSDIARAPAKTDKEEIFVILRTSVRFETQSTHNTTSTLAFAERSSFFLLQRRVYATRKDYSVVSLKLLWF